MENTVKKNSLIDEIKLTAKEMVRTVKILLRLEKPDRDLPPAEQETSVPEGFLTDKELRKLNRRELLEMLVEETRKKEALKEKVAELEEKLSRRQVIIQESGSLAEACLKINGVFEAAQAAADQYLDNLKQFSETQTERSEP